MKRVFVILGILVGIVVLLGVGALLFFPIKYKSEIMKYSEKYSLQPSLIASVINIESGYDKQAESKVGARGLMQVLPATAIDCAIRLGIDFKEEDLWDIETNLEIGCFYLSYLLELFDGNVVNSLCAYNWGLGNVREYMLNGNIDNEGTIINIPVEETKNYVKKYYINDFVYKKIYGYDR